MPGREPGRPESAPNLSRRVTPGATMRNRSGQWLQRVHVSVFARQESAAMAARSFQEKEGQDAIVVRYTEGIQ